MRNEVIFINTITLSRPTSGILVFFFARSGHWLAALILIIWGILSDLLDGFLARKWKAETKFGKIVDPIVDIAFDWFVIFGIATTVGLNFWVLLYFLPASILVRVAVIYGPGSIWYIPGGSLAVPNLVLMIWLVLSSYGIQALGREGLIRTLYACVPVAAVLCYLKRDRIKKDVRQYLGALFK